MTSILLIFALIGVTLIVVRGTVCAPIRRIWPSLLGCSQCTGTWVGIAAGASGIVSVGQDRVFDAIVVGGALSFLALLADAVLLKLLGDPSEEKKS